MTRFVALVYFLVIACLGLVPARVLGESAAGPEGLAGWWRGTLVEQRQALPVTFSFAKRADGWSGTFTSESQAVMEYPFDSVRVTGTHAERPGATGFEVRFSLGGGDIEFTGKLAGDRLVGTFAGDEGQGTFAFERSATPEYPYVSHEVTFRNGDVTLSGSLYVPLGRGKHPAVVLVHGSGPQTRWGTTRFIGDRLARHGFACLIYDKRGSGASGGDWRTVGYEALADDAIAGMRLLAARPDIDAARIGVWGHSQGGFIAPLIATRYPQTAFIVAADSTAGTNEQQDILRVQNLIGDQDWSDADKRAAMALYRRFLAVAASGQGYAELESEIRSSGNAPWVRWLGIPPADSWLWTWYPLVAHYDSRTYWRTVRVPVLLLYGERDELSDIDPSIRAISVLVRANGGPEVQAIILPDAPHELHIAPKAGEAFFWWHIVAGYPSLGIDWLAETAR